MQNSQSTLCQGHYRDVIELQEVMQQEVSSENCEHPLTPGDSTANRITFHRRIQRGKVCCQAARTLRNGDDVSELQIPDGEVDDGGVLLPEEVVLGEALEVQHQVGWQASQLVPAPPVLDVVVHPAPVKLAQQLKNRDLCSSREQSASSCRLLREGFFHTAGRHQVKATAGLQGLPHLHCWRHLEIDVWPDMLMAQSGMLCSAPRLACQLEGSSWTGVEGRATT